MTIRIRGAREHNLQGIDVDLGDGLTAVTGVSGSGKTSLVCDTLYHEARRRFLDTFSLGSPGLRLPPAKVHMIAGLGPAVEVGQNLLNRNPLSTLATASGLHPLFRLLYARFGVRYCPSCQTGVHVSTEDEIVERLVALARQNLSMIYVPLMRGARGSHRLLLDLLATQFGARALHVDGQLWRQRSLRSNQPHDIDVEIARLEGSVSASQARQAVRRAAALGAHSVVVQTENLRLTLSRVPVCGQCGTWLGDLEPEHFRALCPHCRGAGCERCWGSGLYPEAVSVRWNDLRLPDLLACSIEQARSLLAQASLPSSASRLRREIERRLETLDAVGLGYITLDRPSPSLSRGEAQRVRLAVALTSRLEDMLYVLDEPTVGQHALDVARLLPTLRRLPGPVVYVEHDCSAVAFADQTVDLGPGPGHAGGRVLFAGTPADLWKADTPSGRYFSGREQVTLPVPRPHPDGFLILRGVHLRNLQGSDVAFPLRRLTVITGVSGSGKSTLVADVLVASLDQKKPIGCQAIEGSLLEPVLVDQSPIGRNPRSNPATYTHLADLIRGCFAASTGLPASHFSFNRHEGACPACKGMGAIEVRMRYLPSTWVLCEACAGRRFSDQVLAAQVAFGDRRLAIADIYELTANQVADVLQNEGRFPERSRQAALRILKALCDVGLGYLPLGQPSPTLSGGEAQRIKLAKHLGSGSLDKRLLVLDEPSTGLHPQDVARLLVVLDRLVRAGATVVVVEHNLDLVRAADWAIDLGPGAGPAGGRIQYAGPPAGLLEASESMTGKALREEALMRPRSRKARSKPTHSVRIAIRGACAHNLKRVNVDFPKGAITVVTGVSGSGKSSLVSDVLESEAKRRFLETLSSYERQSAREGLEAPVERVSGLGVAIGIGPERRLYDPRSSVGTATELAHHLAVLLARIGERRCLHCGATMTRGREWHCPRCGSVAPVAEPKHFSPLTYGSACSRCGGVGTLQVPQPRKLIVHPDKSLCGGAMYSPGFFPKGYLCKPLNGGYDVLQALAARYEFDPATTPWNQMSPEAQHAFLFGDSQPLTVTFHSRLDRIYTKTITFHGFYGWLRDWDVVGTYTDTTPCPDCQGARLRPEYLAVTLGGYNIHQLSEMPLSELARVLERISLLGASDPLVGDSLQTASRRLHFLLRIGLSYLQLSRLSSTLSAGEAQRVRLAGLLGSGLTAFTVLLDEPTRGMHPSEVESLLAALADLRAEGNTVIVVEHDLSVIRAADHVVELGPGAGTAGGQIVAQGSPEQVARASTATARWLLSENRVHVNRSRRPPRGSLTIRGARENNLHGEDVCLPLGVLVGVCGVSGSGKSTLLIDTLGRALAPRKHTTSVAIEPIEPGRHEDIEGAPARTIIVDQTRAHIVNPGAFLGITPVLRSLYADSEDAQALGISEEQLTGACSACHGRGSVKTDMGFLPDIYTPCETCRGTGCVPEAWEVHLRGVALPDVFSLTIDQVYDLWRDESALARPLAVARDVGLGYLVLRQPGHALSGGEAQRLKIARELARKAPPETLYLLDEPTVGQHLEDVARLIGVLHRLVDAGHTVVAIEHHPHLLACCDWLVELGPGSGPDGGRIIASGPPEDIAHSHTPTAPYLRQVLENDV